MVHGSPSHETERVAESSAASIDPLPQIGHSFGAFMEIPSGRLAGGRFRGHETDPNLHCRGLLSAQAKIEVLTSNTAYQHQTELVPPHRVAGEAHLQNTHFTFTSQ